MSELKDNEGKKIQEGGKKRIPSRILIILVTVIISIGIIFSARQFLKTYSNKARVFTEGESVLKSTMGGPFSLTNQHGITITEKDLLGKYFIVFFGYTYCPDICPTALTNISDALDILGEKGKMITPVFISVDPVRDTVKHLKEYAAFFHARLVALTGSEDEIKVAAKAYRVYYAKASENKNDPQDYLMDHSAISYLMGPDGGFLAHFSHGLDPEVLAKRISENLGVQK